MNKNTKKKESRISGFRHAEHLPAKLTGSEDNYSVDVQSSFPGRRQCVVFYAFNAMCYE